MQHTIKFLFFKQALIVFCLALFPVFVCADSISYNKAKEIAGRYVNISSGSRVSAMAGEQDSYAPFYIFNDAKADNGFVIIAGNDNINPVLGYSRSGHLDEKNMPDGLKAWLEAVKDVKAGGESRSEEATVKVAPLIKTQWYQSVPYNNKAPEEGCLTGCVATAMAQVMNYHKWPERGHGSVNYESYNPLYEGDDTYAGWLSTDLSKSVYDWDNMRITYQNGDWTDAEAEAVSTLMRDCGYAAYMQYTTYNSVTYDNDAAVALAEHFGYDVEVVPHFGDVGTGQWLDMIKNELDCGFPVIMTGQQNFLGGGGHCFIADGYDSNDFLHINWGWNGEADGFYNIASLSPVYHGSVNNFSYMQYFTSVRPRRPYTDAKYNPSMMMLYDLAANNIDCSGLTADNSGIAQSKNLPVNVRVDGLWFISNRGFNGRFELALFDESNNIVKTVLSKEVERSQLGSQFESLSVGLSSVTIPAKAFDDVPDGKYTLCPMSVCGDMPAKRIQTYGYKKNLNVVVEGDEVAVTNIAKPAADLHYTSPLALPAEVPLFSKFETTIGIENRGDFMEGGWLDVVMYSSDRKKKGVINTIPVTLYEKRRTEFPLTIAILNKYHDMVDAFNIGEEYTIELELTGISKEQVSIQNPFGFPKILITDDPELRPYVEITSINVTDENGNMLDFDNLRFDINKKYYINYEYRTVAAGAAPDRLDMIYNFEESGYNSSSMDLFPSGKESLTISDLAFTQYKLGDTFFTISYLDPLTGEKVLCVPSNMARFKVNLYDSLAGLDNVVSKSEEYEVARYNAVGVKLENPVHGMNIVIYSDGSVRKEFVNIKK